MVMCVVAATLLFGAGCNNGPSFREWQRARILCAHRGGMGFINLNDYGELICRDGALARG
jgi:hypothetical protein